MHLNTCGGKEIGNIILSFFCVMVRIISYQMKGTEIRLSAQFFSSILVKLNACCSHKILGFQYEHNSLVDYTFNDKF